MCGGPSSSLSKAYLAALSERPRIPSPHSFSALWRTHTLACMGISLHTYSHAIKKSLLYDKFNNVIHSMPHMYHWYMYVCDSYHTSHKECKCFSQTYRPPPPCLICNQDPTAENASRAGRHNRHMSNWFVKIRLHSHSTAWQLCLIRTICRVSFSGTVLDRQTDLCTPLSGCLLEFWAWINCVTDKSQTGFLLPVTQILPNLFRCLTTMHFRGFYLALTE